MHDYLLSTEVVRFAFVLGVAVSMLMYERRHLTTGSIVVPGYIASFIVFPLIILATFFNALVSYLIVNKLLDDGSCCTAEPSSPCWPSRRS